MAELINSGEIASKHLRNCCAKKPFMIVLIICLVVFCLVILNGCTSKNKSTLSEIKEKELDHKKTNKVRKQKSPKELLRDVHFWAYQIQKQDNGKNMEQLANSHYDLLVMDQTRSLKGDEDYDSKEDVALVKNSSNSRGGRKLVICYIDVGEAESYRWYWQKGWKVGNPDWIVGEDPDGWDENYPVKFWQPEWKDIMKKNIDRIIEDGYDGVYLDWLEVYSFEPVAEVARAEGLEPHEALADFVAELFEHARAKKPDFLFIAQNAAELGTFPEYTKLFDAIAQEAVWYDGAGDPDTAESPGDEPWDPDESQELVYLLEEWQKLGTPVLNVEYAQESANVKRAYKLGKENGFRTYVTLRPLDRLTSTPPPGY
ncbi:MAG: MJ1477/TM1410 family putative glycoside hydrolase [Pseudomonadota bacterium]